MSDTQHDKPLRVLSCVLCQQRKVRCDRTVPCANCVKSKAQCVPGHLIPRRRKRRFPERELLDRLRRYENLLRQHDIRFDPLHGEPTTNSGDHRSLQSVDSGSRPPDPSSAARPQSSEGPHEAKDFWNAMNQGSPESDEGGTPVTEMTEAVVRKTWDQVFDNSDPLFGTQNTPVDLSSLHPEASQIFRFWHIYLDPLFKVTHTPTLQGRIVEAIANLKAVKPATEALMFGIYCVAISSLMQNDCETLFGSTKDELQATYQRHCHKALVSAGFLRSDDRDCLTAFLLYLVSLRPSLDPRTLSSMLSIAVRTAQRMGIHSETSCARYPPMEAEMRRRLWWALVLFDARIGEMADYRSTTLNPLWDCKIPSSVNDLDLRPDMKHSPDVYGRLSEALFVVIRCELGEFLRNSSFHLDFIAPSLKTLARKAQLSSGTEASELDAIERLLEEQYLKFCNPDNPLHFITLWLTRGALAKYRLFEYYSRYMAGHQTEADRDTAMSYVITMLDCGTRIVSSDSTQRYLWLMYFYFPFPAYIHILQDLRRRPLSKHAGQAWISMGDNFESRSYSLRQMSPRLFYQAMTTGTMIGIVFQAWEATKLALRQSGQPLVQPKIVSIMREWQAKNSASPEYERPPGETDVNPQTGQWAAQMDLGLQTSLAPTGGDSVSAGPEVWFPFDVPMQIPSDGFLHQSEWSFLNSGW
ncbi:hypothetical protein BDV12DRAFT_102825 [Aspergillus spectabilis]